MTAGENVTLDLNETIAAAVRARVEAQVLEALSGDEAVRQFVAAALAEPVEHGDRYSRKTEPYIRNVLRKAFQEATKQAVGRLLAEEMPLIEDEVRKALRRNAGALAEQLTTALGDAASEAYGVTVGLKLPGDGA